MLQAEDSSNWNQLPAAYGFAGVDLDDEGMSMDVDTLLGLISEESPVISALLSWKRV